MLQSMGSQSVEYDLATEKQHPGLCGKVSEGLNNIEFTMETTAGHGLLNYYV